MKKGNVFSMLGLCLATGCSEALAHGPHVHGTGELQVAVENNNVDVEFHSPLDNLLGFEHIPKTASQHAAVKAMTTKLNKPEALFILPKAASCTADPAHIDSPLNSAPATPSKSAKPAHKEDNGEEHADLTATFRFVCTNVAELDSIEIAIFDAFPGTRTIKAEIIGPRGQSAATLSPNHRVIKF